MTRNYSHCSTPVIMWLKFECLTTCPNLRLHWQSPIYLLHVCPFAPCTPQPLHRSWPLLSSCSHCWPSMPSLKRGRWPHMVPCEGPGLLHRRRRKSAEVAECRISEYRAVKATGMGFLRQKLHAAVLGSNFAGWWFHTALLGLPSVTSYCGASGSFTQHHWGFFWLCIVVQKLCAVLLGIHGTPALYYAVGPDWTFHALQKICCCTVVQGFFWLQNCSTPRSQWSMAWQRASKAWGSGATYHLQGRVQGIQKGRDGRGREIDGLGELKKR